MASKRCIDCASVNSLRFTNMGTAARAFYLSLIANADADGCVEAGFILRATRTRKTALQELIDNGFVAMLIPDNNIVWIVNWQSFNTNDKRYGQPSHYRQTLLEHFPNIKCTPFTSKNDDNPTGNTTEDKTIPDKKIPEKTIIYDINGGSDDHHNNPDFSSDNRIPTVDDVITECQKLGYVSETKTIAEQFISTNEKYQWKLVLKDNKPWIDVLKQFLGQNNYANKVNPEDKRIDYIRKLEQEAEEERRRAEEEAKHWQGETHFSTGQEFVDYLKGGKWTTYDECLANDLFWMSEYTETEFGWNHDDNDFTEQELIEMFESGIIRVDMQVGITELFSEPDIAICQNNALVAKIRKQQASYKPTQKPPKPEPFIPNPTAFDDLQ